MADDKKKIYPEGSGQFGPPDSDSRPGRVEDGDDLPNSTKSTLKDYLSALTQKNAFSITHVSIQNPKTKEFESQDPEIDIRSNSEDQIAEIKSDTNGEQFISLSEDSTEAENLRSLSDSGKFTDTALRYPTLKAFFDKNKRGSGHTLLREIKHSRDYVTLDGASGPALSEPTGRDKSEVYKIPEEAPEVQKRISSILVNNNRFSPSEESPYIRDGAYSNPAGAYGSLHQEFGVYSRNTPLGDLAINDLRKIGASLMLKQTGHAGGNSDPDSENFFTVAPGAFIVTRVSIGETYAGNAHKGSNRRGRPKVDIGVADDAEESWADSQNPFDGSGDFVTLNYGKSFGATNSYLEPFTGNPLAAVTFVCQGLITLFGLSFVIGIFLELLFKEFQDERAQGKDPGSLPMGQYTDAPEATLVSMGVPYLRFPVFTCIAHGLAAFFRLKPPSDDKGNFLTVGLWFAGEAINIFKFIDKINESKGYYVNMMRNVMRDNNAIIDTFSNPMMILGAVGQAALLGGSVKAVLATLVGQFAGLTSFKFFMACAVVGEKSKLNEVRDFAALGNRALIESIEDTGPTRVTKSRVTPTGNTLAWRHRSAPANMILPVALLNAKGLANNLPEVMTQVAAKVGDYEGTERHRRKIDFSETGRISSEDVLKFENELESEYMPFYFHDLRTNEIISFHAFITDMKDSFSVQYSDMQAYGRVDPVKIYNNTQRSINVGFWVIATSQEDFDSMWLSINKLTQMVYPQWSEGRQLTDGGKSFIMPFSQIPTASPMIRLRIGDVVRSNGSKFNLMKLFGLQESSGTGDEKKFSYGGGDSFKEYDEAKANEEVDKAREAIIGSIDVLSEKDVFKSGAEVILKRSTTHPYVTLEGGSGGFLSPPKLPFHTWTRADALVKITKVEDRPGAPKVDTSLGEEFVIKKPYQYRVEFSNEKDPANPNKEKVELIVLASDLKVITTEAPAEENTSNDLTKAGEVGEFFDPAKNSIMQAYESTRGRGLAGFITSLDFDYTDSSYETGSLTRRAPHAVRVSISFSPIHDVAPGMDSKGGMRAPLYPVGDISAHLAGDELANVLEYGKKETKAQEDFNKEHSRLGKRVD